MVFVEPQKSGGYDVYGLLNLTHEIEPIVNQGGMGLESVAHRIKKVETTDGTKRTSMIQPTVYKEDPVRIEPRESSSGFVIETLLIIESELAKYVQRTGNEIHAYASFFTGTVNMILQQLQPPGMILLTGIQTNSDAQAEYLVFTNDNVVDSTRTLKKLAIHVASTSELQQQDMILYLIGRDMIQVNSDGTRRVSFGAAFTGGVCTLRNAVLVTDNGNKFSGVISAAHEIGHLLGSPHDGSDTSTACSPNDGYLMSPKAQGEIRPRFSQCSMDAISNFVTGYAQCLFKENVPTATANTPEVATNTEVGATDQEKIFEKKSNKKCRRYLLKDQHLLTAQQMDGNNTKCNILCTARSNTSNEDVVFAVVAPNGTPCDQSDTTKLCKKGRCV
ncbi:venom metalloproteinase antarease-like TserMP_B [Dermacentor andersoni]|uniref:venom metalloproteinase antarease-like TserMP_B n=1 Tax=Dermacentor andersoni TaxID=34620 RepID=UPI0024178861|nr:A disintegrin and metalloproteinase with thrombospondin motifs like [Dermacentor andersoni]